METIREFIPIQQEEAGVSVIRPGRFPHQESEAQQGRVRDFPHLHILLRADHIQGEVQAGVAVAATEGNIA